MKRVEIATNFAWVLNFLAAFGIFLFAFVFVIFPPNPKKTEYAAAAKKMPPPVKAEGPVDRGRFAPVWGTKLGDVTVPPPTPGVTGFETKVEIAGVMKMTDRKKSLAFVNILSGGEQQRVREGDSVLGVKVKEIRSVSVVFDLGGKDIEIFTKRAAMNSKAPTPNRGTDSPSAPGEFRTKKVGESENRIDWEVDPREIDFVTKNADGLLGQLKLRPYAPEGGEMGGLMVDEITPGSFAAERGFLKGDVVRAVDGQALTSVEEIKKFANSEEIAKKGSISISIERSGRKIDLVYSVGK
ncbi:MAG: hypothetical protein HUU15_05200 [Candidatus Brocadiae bacterium]|nr:hypothetical protein [Candidatus Brocadiia bacterium]